MINNSGNKSIIKLEIKKLNNKLIKKLQINNQLCKMYLNRKKIHFYNQ